MFTILRAECSWCQQLTFNALKQRSGALFEPAQCLPVEEPARQSPPEVSAELPSCPLLEEPASQSLFAGLPTTL